MGTFNAFGFSIVGTLMGFLPALFPSYFPVPGNGGFDTGELWLEFMGSVQGALGTFYIIRNEVLPVILRAYAWRLPTADSSHQPQPGTILRPMSVNYLGGPNAPGRRAAA